MADHTLDVSGLACPIPVLKARKLLATLAPGSTLEVLATSPTAEQDFIAFCDAAGHDLVSVDTNAAGSRLLIRRGP